ncbi:MAG: ribosome small subunit-dependent GTPase A [Pseudomonadota bacterium]|nr:ribosome small subunit-dependent GTPase A [Pseudomonadota bacterium]
MPSSPSAPEQAGRVVSGFGRHQLVEADDGRRVRCNARSSAGDIVVGDRVAWQPSGDEGVITAVQPRRNLFHRQDEWRVKTFAANVDQLFIVVAAQPVFSESQLARSLVAAAAASIPARVILNKTDLPEIEAAQLRLEPYAAMEVDIVRVALKTDTAAALDRLAPLAAGQATLVLGPSGAGKSTLVNALVRDAGAQVGEISQALRTGRHTTTATHWYWIDETKTAALVDSPGFQQFGLRHVAADQLAGLMPDLAAQATTCRFYNCLHVHEPGCGVRAAAEAGVITPSRYRIYLEILDELKG